MSSRTKNFIRAKPAANPRKDRGATQRIYLLKIYPIVEPVIEVEQPLKEQPLAEEQVSDDISELTDSDPLDSDLDTDSNEPEPAKIVVKPQVVERTIIERKFDLCGTTNNIYTVIITDKPTCTCPDHMQRKNRCKHIFFILVKVMKVSRDNEDKPVYTEAELRHMFDQMPQHMTDIKSNVVATDSLLTSYSNVQSKIIKSVKSTKPTKSTKSNGEFLAQKITDDSRCPVCLEGLADSKEAVVHCKYGCGSVVHDECIKIYNAHRKKVGYPPICLVCQKRWIAKQVTQANSHPFDDVEYVNLK
jgi:hypothetical protein